MALTVTDANVTDERRFVLELGRALHALGGPSYRIEDAMDACARALGLQGSFFATPTAIFASLGDRGSQPATTLLRVQPGEHDLGKLADLYQVRDAVVQRRIPAAAGLDQLAAVIGRPPTSAPITALPAFGLSGAAAAVFLGGGVADAVASIGIGLCVGVLAFASRRLPRVHRVFEPAAGAFAAFAACAAARVGDVDVGTTTLASIVPLLPGLMFTTALAELSMRHLASGSARLLGAIAAMLTLAVGVGLGARLGVLAFGATVSPLPAPLDPLWQVPATGIAAFAFSLLLRARPRQWPAVLASVLLALVGARAGTAIFGRELGAFVGALLVAVGGNLYSRWFRAPSAVLRTAGLFLLVPGSLGLRGLTTALQQDFGAGAQFAFQMLLVGGALVAGLLTASVLLPPALDIEPEASV